MVMAVLLVLQFGASALRGVGLRKESLRDPLNGRGPIIPLLKS